MRSFFVTALIALGVAGGTLLQAQATGTMPANHASMPMQQGREMTALLTDPLGSRGASGTASVNGTAVRMTWSGDQPGAVRSWSVRRGSCARNDGLVGAPSAYPAITVDASGGASGSASLGAPLAAADEFHVLVQSSAGSPAAGANATTLACGALGNRAIPARAAVTELTTSPNGSKPAAADHSAMDHSTMDHSSMNMSGSGASRGTASAADPSTNMSSMNMSGMGATDTSLMAIHMRMMADPVIRERVMTDPVLQRMMAQMPGMSLKDMHMDMPGMKSEPSGSGAATSAEAASTRVKPAARPAVKPATRAATKPAAKPAAKPDPAAMPGMDHSKMPGMRKPPV